MSNKWAYYNDPERPVDPPEVPMPICPECGEECAVFYKDSYGKVIGCKNCISACVAGDDE